MKCPFCRSTDTEVFNTRRTKFGSQVWRRRRCQSCHEAFTTYEAPDLSFIQVKAVKGPARPYSRSQVYSAIALAFEPTGAPAGAVDALTDTIESKLLDLKNPIITPRLISQTILATLKPFSTPAFLRYLASHASLASSAELKRQLKQY